jgi:hypothetical protein
MRAVAIIVLSIVASLVRADGSGIAQVSGTVWLDADRNGRRDASEAGVRGIKLSNGREVTVTDADGRYAIDLRDGDTLFMVRPAGYDLPVRADGLPDFWRHHLPRGSPPLRYGGIAPVALEYADFALRPGTAASAVVDVLVFGDPQPKRAQHVDFYARDIVAPLIGRAQAQFGLSLGDIVDDDLSLYPTMNRATARLGLPWLHLPGNHDLDFDAPRDEDSLHSYRAVYGPESYAWEASGAAFILLDDVIYDPATRGYVGGLRADQFAFLEAYLATVPLDTQLVVAAHIPFHDHMPGRESFRRADRERLFALLTRFPRVLLLSAHAHAQRHHLHGPESGWHGAEPLHEYVVGAACGGFWSGLPDGEGIPDARMNDGTPNGYARLRIDAEGYRLRWHAARDPADTRIALHAPRVLRQGAYPAFAVSANVYMGDADTRVEYRIDAGEWRPMRRELRPDPDLVAINVDDDASPELRSFDRAVEAQPSTHLWRGTLPTDLALGEHVIEVRAFDRWDGELRARTTYRLAGFAPE